MPKQLFRLSLIKVSDYLLICKVRLVLWLNKSKKLFCDFRNIMKCRPLSALDISVKSFHEWTINGKWSYNPLMKHFKKNDSLSSCRLSIQDNCRIEKKNSGLAMNNEHRKYV